MRRIVGAYEMKLLQHQSVIPTIFLKAKNSSKLCVVLLTNKHGNEFWLNRLSY